MDSAERTIQHGPEYDDDNNGILLAATSEPIVPIITATLVDPSQVDLTWNERSILEFFWKAGMYFSAPYLLDGFWYNNVQHVSAFHPAVKHSGIMLACAILRYQYHYNGLHDKSKEMEALSLRQKSKAIAHLLELPTPTGSTSKRGTREIMMTSCAIMIVMANLHEDLPTAQTHLRHGEKIMDEWRDDDFDGGSPLALSLLQTLAYLQQKFQVLSNLELYLRQDDYSPGMLRAPLDLDEKFDSGKDLSTVHHFLHFWSWIISRPLIDGFSMGTVDQTNNNSLLAGKVCMMGKVPMWERQFRWSIEQIGFDSASRELRDTHTLLELWRKIMWIKFSAASPESGGDDQQLYYYDDPFVGLSDHFQRVNVLARKLLQSQIRNRVSKPAFPVEASVILPLFFCGFHCRDWTIRRESLELLGEWEDRFEASFSSTGLVTRNRQSALEHLIAVESEGLRPGQVVPPSARVHYVRVVTRPTTTSSTAGHRDSTSPKVNFSFLRLPPTPSLSSSSSSSPQTSSVETAEHQRKGTSSLRHLSVRCISETIDVPGEEEGEEKHLLKDDTG